MSEKHPKAFVSYTSKDGTKVGPFVNKLKEIGFEIAQPFDQSRTKKSLTVRSFYESINDDMLSSDLIVIMFSKDFQKSKAFANQAQALRILADLEHDKKLFVVALDDTKMPPEFWAHQVIYANTDPEKGLSFFSHLGNKVYDGKTKTGANEEKHPQDVNSAPEENPADNAALERIRKALVEGNLTLVCGAGISVDAAIPKWEDLLDRLLTKMLQKLSSEENTNASIDDAELDEIRNSSSLIVGRYLKDVLDDDFLSEVRDALYQTSEDRSQLIDAIVQLARPRRSQAPLDSIITFNFDDLLEQNLKRASVDFSSIFSEGSRAGPDDIPIYHVHGYLPKAGPISNDMNIVFSEDAYHDQFIDPFSWSNLIQLTKYSQNTCLFIGLSLTDPNLRRLLDVARRKAPDDIARHVIVQSRSGPVSQKDRLVESLRQKDAANLGLTTLWIEDFDILPNILKDLPPS